MSLIRMALRIAAVAALRDAGTLAGARVYDSNNAPLAQALSKMTEEAPYVVVFTDNDNELEIDGLDISAPRRNLFLVLEIGVAKAITIDKVVSIDFPPTDAAMEAAVDALEYQAQQALFVSPRSKWGEVLRQLVMRIERRPSSRGAGAPERGSRWAGRQITYVCDTIAELPDGIPARMNSPFPQANHALRRFVALAKVDADPQIRAAAELVEALLTDEAHALASWQQNQAWRGLTLQGIRAMGLGPLGEVPAGSTRAAVEEPAPVIALSGEAPTLGEVVVTDHNFDGGLDYGETDVTPIEHEGFDSAEAGDSAGIFGTVP